MRYPKIRELKEALVAVFSPRFTTRFPDMPCSVPQRYRGKPEFDIDNCIGCGACVNICPTNALTMVDETNENPPKRVITQQADACIFCGNCEAGCTTEKGIKLSDQWDLAHLDRETMRSTHEFELQLCEKCGAVVGTKKHLIWLYEKLGPLAYTNPSLLLAKSKELASQNQQDSSEITQKEDIRPGDFMRILCPKCKCELNIKL